MWEGEGCGGAVLRLISGTLLQVIDRFWFLFSQKVLYLN